MTTADELLKAAIELAEVSYPIGWAGAAAIRTNSGKILTSIAPKVENDALALCMKVGAYLEANKINEAVTHSLCVSRENEVSEFKILSPCGICQERLRHWGRNVKVAVTNPENIVLFKDLWELQPFHWSEAY